MSTVADILQRRRNPYLVDNIGGGLLGDLSPGADKIFPDWASVGAGAAWENAQGRATGIGAPAVNNRYGVQRLTKNPALENLFNRNVNRVGADAGANDADMARYLGLSGDNQRQSLSDLGQEGSYIDDAFNGNLDTKLAATRAKYGLAARTTNDNAAAVLADMRARYGAGANALIDRLASDLGTQRNAYEGRTLGEIGGEETARAGMRNKAFAAERAQADLGIDTAFRDWKAQQGGNAGSTYALRSLAAPRAQTRAALAVNNAAVERGDYDVTRGQRAALTDRLSALERGEIAGAGAARLNLGDTLNSQDRADFAHTLGQEEALNRDLNGQERSDLNYVRDQAGRLIGVRRLQRNAVADDALRPITARNALTETQLRNLGVLGQLDDANNFYSVRDAQAENYRPPRVPYFNRARGDFSMPDYSGYFGGPATPLEAAAGVPRNARGGVGTSPQTAARELYFQQTGVYPENDPNFSEQAWRLAQQNAAVQNPRQPQSYDEATGVTPPPIGWEGTGGQYFQNTQPTWQGFDDLPPRYREAA